MADPDWGSEHRSACFEQATQIGAQRANQRKAQSQDHQEGRPILKDARSSIGRADASARRDASTRSTIESGKSNVSDTVTSVVGEPRKPEYGCPPEQG